MSEISFKKLFKYGFDFVNLVRRDEITLYAAQSSYFVIISAIPFILLLLAVVRKIMPFESYTLLAVIEPYVPYNFMGMVEYVVNEVYDKSSSYSVLSVSAVTLVWSASKGISSLSNGICRVYEQKPSGYIKTRLKSMMYTFLFVIIFIAVVVFMVFGRLIKPIQTITEGPLATSVALALFFSGLYYVSSRRKLAYVKHLLGAAIAAAGWFVFSYFFGIYIDKFVDYSYIYGSLGAAAAFMLWLYFCMNIVLIGAEINVYIFEQLKSNNKKIRS